MCRCLGNRDALQSIFVVNSLSPAVLRALERLEDVERPQHNLNRRTLELRAKPTDVVAEGEGISYVHGATIGGHI